MATEQQSGGGTLEQELEKLLDVEMFEPPDDFRKQANITDDGL